MWHAHVGAWEADSFINRMAAQPEVVASLRKAAE
jgi:hypothetical protein